jgi:predicted HicB family RNase H-like nuclease
MIGAARSAGLSLGMSAHEIDRACAIKSGMNRYAYRVEWSPNEGTYVGSCIEVPFLRRAAPTAQQALADIAAAVDQYVEDAQTCGEEAPTPLSERSYSGTIVVRTSPELHARLAREATEQKLAGRQLGGSLGPFVFD